MTRPALSTMLAAVAAAAACHRAPPVADVALTPAVLGVTTISNAGFAGPENVVYDSAADVYLVSNVNGGPAARDDNGFVSRVAPDGRVLALRWIAGGVNGAVLDAPKGLAIRGDTLAVADVGAVHFFDRRTGAPLGTVALPGLVMNDVAFTSDGTLWITDTGPNRGTGGAPTDTSHDVDAVWRVLPGGRVRAAARGLALGRPDGIVLDGADALVATFGANRVERVTARGDTGWVGVATLPGGRVDGLRRLPDGALAVTSWDAGSVWRLVPGTAPRTLLTGVESPAGVAVDTRRHRLAVTSMQGNALYLLPLR
jgi:sugar lactone lactonase YvrE